MTPEERSAMEQAKTAPQAAMQQVRDAALEEAAKHFQKKLDDYSEEHFQMCPETGAYEAGNRAKEDYANTLEEIIEEIRALIGTPGAGEKGE